MIPMNPGLNESYLIEFLDQIIKPYEEFFFLNLWKNKVMWASLPPPHELALWGSHALGYSDPSVNCVS